MSDELIDSEILADFKSESTQLHKELNDVVDKLEDVGMEDEFPKALLEEFAQKIDRIMGAAQTINMMDNTHKGFVGISGFSELCKKLGYKAAELQDQRLVPIFAGFWADTLEVLEKFLGNIENREKCEEIFQSSHKILHGRLQWLSEKIKKSEKKTEESEGNMAQDMVDDLMKELG